ncbi:MAG TPA: YibE/F family protein [Firmicutes bacterium]|nr:YibE/F family protein [Bacillota bacterium]
MVFQHPANKKEFIGHIIVAVLMVLFVIFLIFFNLGIEKKPLLPADGMTFEKATVIEVLQDNVNEDGNRAGSQILKVEITSGQHRGTVCEASNMAGYLYGAQCEVGTKVIVQVSEYEGNFSASVYNYDRGMTLYILVGLFLVVLCIIGGRKGIMSGISLIFTFVCILFLYLPMMYIGYSPFLAATLVVILTTLVSMYFIGGFSVKTACSVLGTIAGVIVAGVIAMIFGNLSHISGWNVSEIETMIVIGQNSKLQIGGMMFSGILIASLGAVMDVSMSVASTINEIYIHNPQLTTKQLFTAGIHVGQDMMGTMSNTLILAFTGSSINTLMIIYAYSMPYLQIINMYDIGIEILQGISGALGVILTVPFVSIISAMWLTRSKAEKSKEILSKK